MIAYQVLQISQWNPETGAFTPCWSTPMWPSCMQLACGYLPIFYSVLRDKTCISPCFVDVCWCDDCWCWQFCFCCLKRQQRFSIWNKDNIYPRPLRSMVLCGLVCYGCSCDLPFVLTGAALRTTRRFTTSAAGTWTSNVRPTPTWTDWSPRSSPLWHLDFEWEVSQMMHDEAARKLLDTGTPDYSEVEIMDDISWIWWSQISGHINIEMSDIPFTVLVAYVLSWKSPSQ